MPYIGNTIRAADDYRLIDDISSSFNGSTTSFALQVAGSAPVPFPKSPQQVLISVNGVIQEPDPTGASGFNLVGTNIVFSSAPTNGHAFFGIIYATADYLNSGGNFPSGSLGAPSITFVGDEDTGIYRKGSGSVAFVADSTEIANTDSNGITISSGNIIIPDSIIHNGDTNTKIRFPAADTITAETGGVERFRINSTGQTIVGDSVAQLSTSSERPFQVHSINGPKIAIGRNDTSISAGNTIGGIEFYGNDANGTFVNTASIIVNADGTHDNNDKPTRMQFFTTAASGSSATERMRINKDGHILPGTDSTYDLGLTGTRWRYVYADAYYGDGSNLTGINTDLVSDTSPQLGGDLQTNGNNIDFGDSGGASDDRAVFGADTDMQLYHTGSQGVLDNDTGALDINTTSDLRLNVQSIFKVLTKGGSENCIIGNTDGAVELYHNNVKTVETSSSHLLVFADNSGNHGGIKVRNTNTGNSSRAEIRLESENAASFATIFCDHQNTNLRLGYNSTGTTVAIDGNADMITGTIIPNADNSKNLGSASFRWANIFTTDLKLSNEGSSNDVDGTWGNYTIQEGYEDLFLINHRTGKKYKFNLTEVN